jgi:LmbE family N-acetylglucosaminyl deacetylase
MARLRPTRLAALFSLFLLLAARPAPAERTRQLGASEIQKRLQRLSVVGSVLYVAAHPDDENTNLLTYLASGRGIRATYLSITRGDGGQNLIGSEQGALLGLIRTQELLAARRIDGAEQLFTRAIDFGYSKSVDEALRFWGEEEILADVVLAIRRVRPDVIVTRFSSSGGGHGHHTASARLAERAFKAAADPKFQPASMPKLPPWQARRLFANRGGGQAAGGLARLDVGDYDPLLGASYGEIAASSRSMHKSQGFGVARRRGPIVEGFQLVAEAEAAGGSGKSDRSAGARGGGGGPFDGIDWTWARLPGSGKVAKLAAEAARSFRPDDPAASVPALLALDVALEGLSDPFWRDYKRAEVADLVAACTGLWVEANAATPALVPGLKVPVTLTTLNRSAVAIKLSEVRFLGPALAGETRAPVLVSKVLARHDPQRVDLEISAAAEAWPSGPYWLSQAPLPARFQVADASQIGLPENAPALSVEIVADMAGRRFSLNYPVLHKWTDPVAGERSRPVQVVPAVSVDPLAGVLLFPSGKEQPLRVRLKASAARTEGSLRLETGAGFVSEPPSAPFRLAAAGDEVELAFTVRPPRAPGAVSATLRAVAEVGGRKLDQRVQFIEHGHIPIQMYVTPAEVRLTTVDLRLSGKRIGYIPGAGDEVAPSLERVGYSVIFLDEAALASAPLGSFDAIVMGVRAFNTNQRLRFHHARLMDYVRGGGTLVVQYNTTSRLGDLDELMGPLVFQIGRDRVTDEKAPVRFENPRHGILNHPNKITPADFDGWVQERGLYFASTWDRRFETPLSFTDPGEEALRGGLLVARHGRGAFVYTGLAFFRQLPAGVPGAYRLFANLVGHGKTATR